MKREFYKTAKDKRGLSLIELIIVIAIMAILVGVLTPMFIKYVDRARKSKDIYTADQIARAVNVAFAENPEAYDTFVNFRNGNTQVSLSTTHNGVTESYSVQLVAANEGPKYYFKGTGVSGSFYDTINRELGLSKTDVNTSMIPEYKVKKEGRGPIPSRRPDVSFQEVDSWRIVRRLDNGMLEIWVSQPDPWGGFPIYRLWPEPDDLYRK